MAAVLPGFYPGNPQNSAYSFGFSFFYSPLIPQTSFVSGKIHRQTDHNHISNQRRASVRDKGKRNANDRDKADCHTGINNNMNEEQGYISGQCQLNKPVFD